MSAYDNKYWSHRIAQLAEKVPETDDLSFLPLRRTAILRNRVLRT